MTSRVNQFSPRWWKTERIQHSQDLDPVTQYPTSVGGGSGKGLELWSSTKAYAKNDVVFFNSPDVKGIFVANENIPASGFLNIGVDGPTWSVVGDEFASIPNWYAMEWPMNSVVVHAGALRRAIANTSASWVDSEWDNLTPAPVAADTTLLFQDHDQAKSYKKDQVVVVSGKLYRARTNLGALPFSTSDWEEVSPSASAGLTEVKVFDFDTVDTYKANGGTSEAPTTGKIYVHYDQLLTESGNTVYRYCVGTLTTEFTEIHANVTSCKILNANFHVQTFLGESRDTGTVAYEEFVSHNNSSDESRVRVILDGTSLKIQQGTNVKITGGYVDFVGVVSGQQTFADVGMRKGLVTA